MKSISCPLLTSGVILTYPTFNIEPVQLPYPTFNIEPVQSSYPTYCLVDDALTCNTFNLTAEPKCQDVPYPTYEIGTETIQVPYHYSYTACVFDHSECLDDVILGIASVCPR